MFSNNPIRRSFGTIHTGNLLEDESRSGIREYFDTLEARFAADDRIRAGAFALEPTKTGRMHIQFYCEHSRMRPSTLAGVFGVANPQVFSIVHSSTGSWAYCTGTGPHENKEAESRFSFGTPKLHGDGQKADLRLAVNLIMDGAHPMGILTEHPYCYTCHRSRIWALYRDLQNIEKYGKLTDPIRVD